MLTNLPLEQSIFSFIYFQLDWGVSNNQGGRTLFKIFTNWGVVINLSRRKKIENLAIDSPLQLESGE